FLSSRRRHTRSKRDWSSDVCSSDLGKGSVQKYLQEDLKDIPTINYDLPYEDVLSFEPDLLLIESDSAVEGGKYAEYEKIAPTYVVKNGTDISRSEERRVGKEWRCRVMTKQ